MCAKINRQWSTQSGNPLTEEEKIKLNKWNKNPYEWDLFPYSRPDKKAEEIGSLLTWGALWHNKDIQQNTKIIESLSKLVYLAQDFFTKEKENLDHIELDKLKSIVSCIKNCSTHYHNLIPDQEQTPDDDWKKSIIKPINRKIYEIVKKNSSSKKECDNYVKFIQHRSQDLSLDRNKYESFDKIDALHTVDLEEYKRFVDNAIIEIKKYISNQRSIKINNWNANQFNIDYPILGDLLQTKLEENKHTMRDLMKTNNTHNKVRIIFSDKKLIEKSMNSTIDYRVKIQAQLLRASLTND